MVTGFIVAAWLVALGSWLFVSNATLGVAGLCFACFMVITARIAQADDHHKALLALLVKAPAKPIEPLLPLLPARRPGEATS